MTRAISAQRDGLDYQARFFWLCALKLRTGDLVETVTLETDAVKVVDDVSVTYGGNGILDRFTGGYVSTDYYQLKYHVDQGSAFSWEALLDPSFTRTKESLLKRFHKAYESLLRKGEPFRLNLVSNWHWDHRDPMAKYLREGRLHEGFYEGGNASRIGKVRWKFMEELDVSEGELVSFLSCLRLDLGKGLEDLAQRLEPELKLAQLKPLDLQTSAVEYDDLAWKLFRQGSNTFDRPIFEEIVEREKLRAPIPEQCSEISICTMPQMARRPRDVQAAHLDLTDLFEGRFPKDPSAWDRAIPQKVADFLLGEPVCELPQPLHLFFDCHLSIAFLAGNLFDPKFGIRIVPAQKSPLKGYEFWPPSVQSADDDLWVLPEHGEIGTEVVIGVSVTHPIEQHLFPYLQTGGFGAAERLLFAPSAGIGHNSIREPEQAWLLGQSLGTKLRKILPAACRKMHFFYAGPAALAYILGNHLRHVTPEIQLYEHDLEGRRLDERYYPSVRLPA